MVLYFTVLSFAILFTIFFFITHADGSHVSIAICDSVCLYDKTKTAETKIINSSQGPTVNHNTSPTNQ